MRFIRHALLFALALNTAFLAFGMNGAQSAVYSNATSSKALAYFAGSLALGSIFYAIRNYLYPKTEPAKEANKTENTGNQNASEDPSVARSLDDEKHQAPKHEKDLSEKEDQKKCVVQLGNQKMEFDRDLVRHCGCEYLKTHENFLVARNQLAKQDNKTNILVLPRDLPITLQEVHDVLKIIDNYIKKNGDHPIYEDLVEYLKDKNIVHFFDAERYLGIGILKHAILFKLPEYLAHNYTDPRLIEIIKSLPLSDQETIVNQAIQFHPQKKHIHKFISIYMHRDISRSHYEAGGPLWGADDRKLGFIFVNSPNLERKASLNNGELCIYTINGTLISKYKGHDACAMKWRADGNKLASCASDGSIHILNANNGCLETIYMEHSQLITDLMWNIGRPIVSYSEHEGIKHTWNSQPLDLSVDEILSLFSVAADLWFPRLLAKITLRFEEDSFHYSESELDYGKIKRSVPTEAKLDVQENELFQRLPARVRTIIMNRLNHDLENFERVNKTVLIQNLRWKLGLPSDSDMAFLALGIGWVLLTRWAIHLSLR